MKKRVVACILALAMLFTNIVPVAAEGDGWRGSSFQKTIDWLFERSDQIGYAEISDVAADMKPDYSLLQERLTDDGLAGVLADILNSYVKAREANSGGDTPLTDPSVRDSHRRLWAYFQGSVNSYSGKVSKVQPVLQVRDVRETEKEITLSVYEWVYMTYEINGRKDISAHGFDHQMVFRHMEGGWRLVQDLWDTGEGSVPIKPGTDEKEEDGGIAEGSPSDGSFADGDEGYPDGGSGDDNDSGNGSPMDGENQEVNGSDSRDEILDGSAVPGEDGSQDEGTDFEGDGSLEDNTGSDEDKLQGDAETDANREENQIQTPEEEAGSGTEADGGTENEAPKEDHPAEDAGPSDQDETEEEEDSENNSNGMIAGEDGTDEIPSGDTPEEQGDSLFQKIGELEKPEPEGPFTTFQDALSSCFTPLSTMFSLRTLNYTYSYTDAVAYAQRYATSYNPAYENYNSIGGDCANFVSQCLYAGGLPMTDKWYYRNGSRTGSWSLADGLFKYVSENCGTAIVNSDPGQVVGNVTAGNPVFYYSSSKGRYSHTAICVGVNASGVPVVAAHNNDHVRAIWTLGSWAKYAVVKINGNSSNSNTQVPSLPPEELDDSERWIVTADSGLKLREDAGTSYARVGAIPKNKEIKVTEKKTVGEQTWGKTTYSGTTGWCCLVYSANISYASYLGGSSSNVLATGIKLDKTTATIAGIGNTLKLNATVTPSGASPNLVWTSSNLSVATVSNGLVRALSNGEVVITAQTTDGSNKTASCIVAVSAKPVTAVKLNKTSVTLKKAGSTTSLRVSYTPSSPANPRVTWKSSNTKVATVDSNGKVKAVKEGSATITATAKDGFGASATCKVYVGRYTVKYKLNGGKNDSRNKGYYYKSKGMTLYTPTKKGYVFGGWYTKKNLTGKLTKIAKGKTTNYTLYAKWTKPAKPSLKQLKATGSGRLKVYVRKKIAGASGYEIQCATNSRFTQGVKKKRTTAITKTVTGLKKGKRYYVRVRAYTKLPSGEYVYGSYSGYRYATVR